MNKVLLSIILFFCFLKATAQDNNLIVRVQETVKILQNSYYQIDDTVVIAIIDKGVNIQHEDLKDIIWRNRGEIPNNNIDDDKNGFIDDIRGWNFANNTNDISLNGLGNWHGTPVNGIIGADNYNNIGIKGICPKVKLMNLVKEESIESIINSLQYIYNMRKTYNETNGKYGAYVVAINCSWGKDSLFASDYYEWCNLYDSLGSVGIITVNSVPNNNINIDEYGDMPTTCTSEFLITVTNSNKNDEKVYDAGYGKLSVDIAAPGDNSYTTLNSGGYGYFGGTSAAAPYVTGVIGLLYSLPIPLFQSDIKFNPKETSQLIKSVIIEGVDKVTEMHDITVSGGRLNAFNSAKLLCDFYNRQDLYNNIFQNLDILSLYPNPAYNKSTLVIESSIETAVTIELINMNSKLVLSIMQNIITGINTVNIDLTNVNNGFYIVRVVSEKEIVNSKIIVLK